MEKLCSPMYLQYETNRFRIKYSCQKCPFFKDRIIFWIVMPRQRGAKIKKNPVYSQTEMILLPV